jgi:hypothetical protein
MCKTRLNNRYLQADTAPDDQNRGGGAVHGFGGLDDFFLRREMSALFQSPTGQSLDPT